MRTPSLKEEKSLQKRGISLIAGVDEAGRGAWAGPVVAAAVILPQKRIYNIRDSKLLDKEKRRKLYKEICEKSKDFGIGIVSHKEVDRKGISYASKLAMNKALESLSLKPEFVLVDAFEIELYKKAPQKAIVYGDSICLSIAAASILAKVTRDTLLIKMHRHYPEYGFDRHKGYGTELHRERLSEFGPCEIHRRSYMPVKYFIEN